MNDSDPIKRLFHQLKDADRASLMERYFFDVHDGDKLIRDESGIDLPNLNAVHDEAYSVLRELIQERLPEGQRTFTVEVRDEAGNVVYAGDLTVDGKRYRP